MAVLALEAADCVESTCIGAAVVLAVSGFVLVLLFSVVEVDEAGLDSTSIGVGPLLELAVESTFIAFSVDAVVDGAVVVVEAVELLLVSVVVWEDAGAGAGVGVGFAGAACFFW